MKKRTLLICAILACAIVLSSCCATIKDVLRLDPETAEELWERIGEVMREFDSHEISMEMDMVMVVEGYAVESSAAGKLIEDTGDDYYYYSETNITVTCDELSLEQEMRSISAYMDGKAFEFRGEDGYERKLYSKMTKEEYAAYLTADREESSIEADITDCTKAEFAKNEDKTWTLTYSGYTKKAIKSILGALSTQELDVFGADIVDVKVTFLTDEDFCVTDITMQFEFDTDENAKQVPVLDVRMKLTAMGDAVTRVTDTIDASKYKEVDDLAIRKEIDKLIEERTEAEYGEFRYELQQQIKVMGQTENSNEIDVVKYGTENGKYYYDISIETADATVSYRNGMATVKVSGETYTETQTEKDAKAFIAGLINEPDIGYNSEAITNIIKKNNTHWEIEQAMTDASVLEAAYEAMGGTYKSAQQTIYVTIENGKLVKIQNCVKATGSVKSGRDTYEVAFSMTITVDFTD